MDGITQAFLDGYRCYHDHPTEETKRRGRRAKSVLLDEPRRYTVLNFAEKLGAKEGLYAALYMRRDRLWHNQDIKARKWSRQLAGLVDYTRLYQLVTQAHIPTDSTQWEQAAAIKPIILAYLQSLLADHPDLAHDLNQLSSASKEMATAEGLLAAAALLQLHNNRPVPDLDDLYKTTLNQVQTSGTAATGAQLITQDQMAGLAGDLAQSYTKSFNNDDQQDNIDRNAKKELMLGVGAAFFLDLGIQTAYSTTQKDYYQRSGVRNVDFMDVGDERTCPQCIAINANNPYTIDEVPMPPIHGSCRCWLVPSD